MPDLPGRVSDSGPESHRYCPACASFRWHTLSYCQKCGDTHCNHCATITDKGLICAGCIGTVVTEYHQEDWPELLGIADVERCGRIAGLIEVQVQYPQIPEWNAPVNGWVN